MEDERVPSISRLMLGESAGLISVGVFTTSLVNYLDFTARHGLEMIHKQHKSAYKTE